MTTAPATPDIELPAAAAVGKPRSRWIVPALLIAICLLALGIRTTAILVDLNDPSHYGSLPDLLATEEPLHDRPVDVGIPLVPEHPDPDEQPRHE
jgi:hypothetical protein